MTERLDPLTLPLWGSRLIEASAGTGKTWTIAALYLRLVLGHGEADARFGCTLTPPEILVMTFTRAATRELSDRIRTRLVDAAQCFRGRRAVAADDVVLSGLIAAYPEGSARDAAAWRLAMAAEGMDDAAVFTIDAWVQRMLREHAFDSGCLFDEEVQADEEGMLGEAARDYWRQEVYPLAADTLAGVVAVWPDVDALTTDVRRLVAYVGHDPDARASLGTIWQRAAAERGAALAALKHGWPARVDTMRAWIHAQLAAKDRPFNGRRLQGKRADEWLDRLLQWAGDPQQATLPMTPTSLHRLSRDGLIDAMNPGHALDIPAEFEALERLVDALRGLAEPSHAIRRHAAVRVATRLKALKQRAGTYGFTDMLERLDEALRGTSGERLRARIVAQYPVALIDEFQDTSALQYRIFDTLYRTAANDRATALLLIGDPKQSIYGFRGADLQSYLRARAAMADRHAFLGTNYRATGPLVAVVNRLFGQAEARGGAGAFRFGATLPFIPVDARGRTDVLRSAAGPVPSLTVVHDALLSSRADAQRRFAEHCAAHIVTLLDDAQAGFVDPVKGFVKLKPADLTVLVRDRREAAAIRRALRNRRVPSVYLSDQDSVFASAEAADLLHWLRAVAEPLDGRLARVAFATTLIGLPLDRMAQLSQDDTAFERRLDDLKALNGEWRRLGVLPMLRRTLHRLELPARWLSEPDGERRLTNLLHLAELLQAASAKLDGEQALIRWLAGQFECQGSRSDEQVVRLESDDDLVRVVTIHKAKGLEYPVVYLPFVCSVRLPKWKVDDVDLVADAEGMRAVAFDLSDAAKRRMELEAQQEDLRLLYVAVTRAQHALWIGVAPLKTGRTLQCVFHRSAFGYLLSGGDAVPEHEIEQRLDETFGALPSVVLTALEGPAEHTRLAPSRASPLAVDAAAYAGCFERDWAIGSFSAFVRDLARAPMSAVMVDPAVEEELLSGPVEDDAAPPSSAPRHRFPRGPLPGNFLHDQLEWLAGQRFALSGDAKLREQLVRRCERLGWGHRANDVVTWLGEVVDTRLPPLGLALKQLLRILPEMEFWFPSEGIGARRIDALCREHLLGGRDRPALPERTLRGMLMGFADLVFEADGRYWVLDYKSNALGAVDGDYTRDALERSMAVHRYDVQSALYLLALHRLLRQRLGTRYDPARQLGGALYLFLRGIKGPEAGCYVVEPGVAWLDALDDALGARPATLP